MTFVLPWAGTVKGLRKFGYYFVYWHKTHSEILQILIGNLDQQN